MDAYRQKIRRLNLAVNRIDGIYYQLSKILGEKDNLTEKAYMLLLMEEQLVIMHLNYLI